MDEHVKAIFHLPDNKVRYVFTLRFRIPEIGEEIEIDEWKEAEDRIQYGLYRVKNVRHKYYRTGKDGHGWSMPEWQQNYAEIFLDNIPEETAMDEEMNK